MSSLVAMTQPTFDHAFDRPAWWRRAAPLALIVALHLGLFHILQSGLVQDLRAAAPLEVVTTILFAPAPTPAPVATVPAKTPPQPTPARKPVERAVVKPVPTAKPAPVVPPPDIVTAPAAPAAPVAPAAPAIVAPAPPAAAAAPAAPVAPSQPRTTTSGVQYLQPPQPEYPAQSKRLSEEGRVILRVLVNPQGRAERIDVQKSSGFARLDDAARDAVRQAIFKPQLEDGRAVAVVAIVPINFKLD